ncbi:Imm21 family immunity protein [Variovorax sp.]|jgi:hypothetical protein|uniref:Imm21 family immunity protein n=1 Tax=Variovorax sp. TaxID=1871043 RepID=UPI0011FEFB4F|nr:Imm21 family immunity protein [Variovorax sp.]TAJ61682.1 MAG: hypothetical protein EPO53_22220 [Variovorax sp.]
MKSISSGGGPLVCIELDAVDRWHGVAGSEDFLKGGLERANDYQRACSIRDYLGQVSLGDRTALVLGDMPLETSIWQRSGDLPRIVRVYYGDSGADIHALLEAGGELNFDDPVEAMPVEFSASPVVVFDSACSGADEAIDRISFEIPKGKYIALTKKFEPDERTSVLVHFFVKAQ